MTVTHDDDDDDDVTISKKDQRPGTLNSTLAILHNKVFW